MDVIFDVELTAKYLPKKNEIVKSSSEVTEKRERETEVFLL